MVRQAVLNWTGSGGVTGQTALYFQDAATVLDIDAALANFVPAIRPALANTTTVTLAPFIRDLDTASGVLTGEEPVNAPLTWIGTGGSSAVPNAAQGLIRFGTGVFVNGRQLKGRIYVPGMSASTMLATGEINATGTNALAAGGAALVTDGYHGVWHRPVNAAGGVIHPSTSSSVWNEYAIQRRRRG